MPNAGAFGIAIEGEVKLLSLATVPPAPKAEFGALSLVVVEVSQSAAVLVAVLLRAVVQPAGKAGAVTPSKFSVKTGAPVCSRPRVNGMLTLPRSKAPSCKWKVRVIVPPQVPLLEKRKLRLAVVPESTMP